MSASMQHLLRPQVLTRVISQQAKPSNWLAALFGIQSGTKGGGKGKNVLNEGHGRHGSYIIYNHLRRVAAGKAPGAAAHRTRHNQIGEVMFTYPRMFDSMEFNIERLNNIGKITNPRERDKAGMVYIEHQTRSLNQLAENWRKAMVIGAVRDELYIGRQGDDEWFDFKSTSGVDRVIQMPIGQRPNGNKGRLNMLGAGNIIDASWSDPATDIPAHYGQINVAFNQLCGGKIFACVMTNEVMQNMVKNNKVKDFHGSVNQPFKKFERESFDPEIANTMEYVDCIEFAFAPGVKWYVTDEPLQVGKPGSETFEKIIPDNKVLFIGHVPDDGTVACYEGSELVRERDHMEKVLKTGLQSWYAGSANPTVDTIFALDNALVVDHVPNSKALGEVLF